MICNCPYSVFQNLVDKAQILVPEDRGPFHWAKLLKKGFLERVLGIPNDDADHHSSQANGSLFELLCVRSRHVTLLIPSIVHANFAGPKPIR